MKAASDGDVSACRVGSLEALMASHEWETEARGLFGGQMERGSTGGPGGSSVSPGDP